MDGYNLSFHYGNDYCINLDSDTIVKTDFVTRLLDLKKRFPDYIISGFNCNHPQNPVIETHEDYVMRKHANGINLLVDKQQYERIILPALSSTGNWDFNSTHDKPFIVAKPSLVQHIGAQDSTMGHTNGDVACDFKLLSLPQVCLFGIDAHDPAGIKRAADICTRDVEFGAVKIITERLFTGREAYSAFMINELYKHVQGSYSHVLTIHSDGFIVNPSAWTDEFLEYDYIGARWLYHNHSVGNGGFSLRSMRLIDACSKLQIPDTHPEDEKICRKYRGRLESEFGIKFAPVDIADMFSIEAFGCHVQVDSDGKHGNDYVGSFGFHGYNVRGLPIQPHGKFALPVPPRPVNKPKFNRIKTGR